MPERKLVSIIVLNHDKAAYSEACLNSLLTSTWRPLEIVAVDNGSTDRTPVVLDTFRRAATDHGVECQVLTNDTNVGAVIGRNQAMKVARGDVFAFVDNDVVVGSCDWLEKLGDVLESAPDVGLVTPKLLFPWAPHDIEFAGCAVSPGGRVQYLGRGEPRAAPEFNVPRQLQCSISACLVFPRWLVEKIGPLDEAFSPVQYEDLDFCYRARAHGYKVLYEPSVEMYHYEHTTTDGSVDINFKYVTIKNGRTFRQRWRHMFAFEGGPPDEEVVWRDLPRQRIEECPPPGGCG